jgi:hypothetical protein
MATHVVDVLIHSQPNQINDATPLLYCGLELSLVEVLSDNHRAVLLDESDFVTSPDARASRMFLGIVTCPSLVTRCLM